MNSRHPWVGLNACDGVSVVALSLVGVIYFSNWLCVPLLIVLLTALVAFSGEPRSRSAELFLVRLFCVVLVSYPLGSALPWGLEAILTGDSFSRSDVIVLIKFISPIGMGVGFVCGSFFYFAVKVRPQIALLIAEFVAMAYAVAAMLQWFQGSASV